MPQLLLEGQNHQNPVASVMFQKEKNTGDFSRRRQSVVALKYFAPSGTSRPGDSVVIRMFVKLCPTVHELCPTVPDCATVFKI
jgi:hypothetical protein